jgi:hypothetical protein
MSYLYIALWINFLQNPDVKMGKIYGYEYLPSEQHFSFIHEKEIDMGATSVTGVSGPGSVAGNQKGSEHQSLGVEKLIGPKIVAAGHETLVGTTGVVEVPAPAGAVTDYMVFLQTDSATAAFVSVALAAVAGSDAWSFTVTAANNAEVDWCLVKKGL